MTKSYDPLFRRDFFKTLGVAALPMLAQGCDAEPAPDEELRAGPPKAKGKGAKGQAATNLYEVSVQRALTEQAIISDRQRCSMPSKLGSLAGVGRQVRITRPGFGHAIYTVDELRKSDDPDVVRMNIYARQRLGTSEPFAASVTNKVVATGLSDAEAEAQSEFVERLVDDGDNNGVVLLAPHGGMIEVGTDKQAEYLTTALSNYGASSWICKGWRQGGGAFDAWHIRSGDLHPDSFPGLAKIANRRFAYAVSFHGMDSIEGGVVVGGGAPHWLKQQFAAAVAAALPTSIAVSVALATDIYDGDSPGNLVNWLTADGLGGIQFEQDRQARLEYGNQIADAIAEVLATLL
jgi:phage replication-related protein YjqB (UPF0714/DUF867 family)